MWTSILVGLSYLLLPLSSSAQRQNPITPILVTFNSLFDDPNISTSTVTCASTLERQSATTFGDVQRFPFIGGTPAIAVKGLNSAVCGSCWNMTLNDNFIFVIAITHEDESFQISHSAYNALTNEMADSEPAVTADVQLIDNRFCGLP